MKESSGVCIVERMCEKVFCGKNVGGCVLWKGLSCGKHVQRYVLWRNVGVFCGKNV